MPGTPLIALSSGVATASAHTWALAPVYLAVTVTEGGTISGNCVMGKVNSASTPSKEMINEITSDNTGRLIKVSIIKTVVVTDRFLNGCYGIQAYHLHSLQANDAGLRLCSGTCLFYTAGTAGPRISGTAAQCGWL